MTWQINSIKNIFSKTSEGQLFPERLKDIFLVAYLCFQEFLGMLLILLLQWRKISQVINYMSWSYLAKKIIFKLVSKSLEKFCKFQAWPNFIYKARSGMQKKSIQNQWTKPKRVSDWETAIAFCFLLPK